MGADIGQYLLDLAEHWTTFMTGGFSGALLLLWERFRRKQIAVRSFGLFLALGFVAASYQAHHQVTDELKNANSKTESVRSDLKSANDQLADIRRQLVEAKKRTPTPQASMLGAGIFIGSGAKNNSFENTKITGQGTGIVNEGEGNQFKDTEIKDR